VNDDDRDAYLTRLGLEAEAPSVDALFRLYRAQVERVPYETVWLHLGERWTVDADEAVARIAHHGRGGYCFHLNGAFSELLRALGYDVTRHIGGVHGEDRSIEEAMANHLVVIVSGLPSDDNPQGVWYTDAGLGDALHEPLPLRAGDYAQGPFRYTIATTPGEIVDWRFTHDARGSFKTMSWRSPAVEMDAFAAQHAYLSTAPESPFASFVVVQRRDAGGADVMAGLALRRVDGTEREPRVITARSEWLAALGDVFGLHLDGADPAAIDRLWQRTLSAHRNWEAVKERAQ
jgi:N-hydroxyarylamine O-acetyltransferase